MTDINDTTIIYDDEIDPEVASELGLKSGVDVAKSINTSLMDDIDIDNAKTVELPGAVIEIEHFIENILPPDQDEFTCDSCFLVKHRSQLTDNDHGDLQLCKDCG
jgi:hypothetical protein